MQHFDSAAEYLEISYQTDIQILIARWLRPVTEAEALRDHTELLAAARHFRTHRWLFDIRRRGRSAPATIDWLLGEYFPEASRELGAPIRLAYFMAPGLRQELAEDRAQVEPTPAAAPGPLLIFQCITEAEAINWLSQE